MAISGNNLDDLVKPELSAEYETIKTQFLVYNEYDSRTAGLFKTEWNGEGMVSLSSKSYYCFGEKNKYSCKGTMKGLNNIQKENYLNVLHSQENHMVSNMGFRMHNGIMRTYTQGKVGLNWFYAKRKVSSDGINCEPLDI